MDEYLLRLQSSCDTIAQEYVTRLYQELDGKPLDRQLLDRLAERTRGRGIGWISAADRGMQRVTCAIGESPRLSLCPQVAAVHVAEGLAAVRRGMD